MPIKKRLKPEERFEAEVGADWDAALRHPLLSPLVRFGKYDTSPLHMSKAIAQVGGWKGATYNDKVFVFLLASLLYRANGQSFLTDKNYDKLRDHLYAHAEEVLEKCGLIYHQSILWDHRKVSRVPAGELVLPKVIGKKPKRRKLKRHKK